MEKELNLVEILKDCPQGTKLYSTIYGEVEIVEIRNNCSIKDPIIYKYKNVDGDYYVGSATADGKFTTFPDGECTLFPSKENRDWSKFSIEPEMVDGEIYYVKNNLVEWIYIYKRTYTFKTSHYVAVLNNYFNYYMEFNGICTTQTDNIKVLRKATEEEKRLFFEIIEKNGRKWDADKKELVKIEKKFDISSLQHFDKIIVRDCNEQKWKCDFYDSYASELNAPFRTTYSWYKQCIPYNDETKHLVSTTKMPPEKYINW
jgi:hypothetical protein